jgi:hypothetical protein
MSAIHFTLPAPHPPRTRTRRLATAVLGVMATIIAPTHAVPDTTVVHLSAQWPRPGSSARSGPAISVSVADVIIGWEPATLNARSGRR